MAIKKISRVKNERGVTLGSLKVGDTFLYDNRIGVIACRNGHDFPMEFPSCFEFRKKATFPCGEIIDSETMVLPIDIELTYKVVG